MPDKKVGPIPGEILDAHTPVGKENILIPHCECGQIAWPLFEKSGFNGYHCPEHGGPLMHDEIIWIVHGIQDVVR